MKKSYIIAIVFILLAAILAGGWFWCSNEVKKEAEMAQEQSEEEQKESKEQKFVVDVDMNIENWQTKETEFFTIQFPKEWYWLESPHGENEGYSQVITNNPNFDIEKHAEIGIFSGIGSHSPLELSNNTEIIITDRGTPTSNSGTPQDSLDSIFEMAKKENPFVQCEILNNTRVPFIAYCSVVYDDSQLQQSYYVINEWISLTLTARTTKNTLVKKEILDKIAKSIIPKDYSR